MKSIRIIIAVLSFSVVYQFAAAQCSGNKIRVVKGSYRCGCHCQKKCINPSELATYQANGWYQGESCWGSCCWVRLGEEAPADTPLEISLEEIYPNPASGIVNIAFTIAQESQVVLEIYDVMGRYVSTVTDAVFEEGGNEVTWDASEVNRGVYFVRMNNGNYNEVKRISVVM